MMSSLVTVGVAREGLSPENPSEVSKTTDLRVALNPTDVERFLEADVGLAVRVFVEEGAGLGIGYTRAMFEDAGARMVPASKLYQESDLLFKLKGPTDEAIRSMKPGATLGCFAHLETFPNRAQAARDAQVNVLALEEILQSPKVISASTAFARGVALEELPRLITERAAEVPHELEVLCFGFTPELFAFAQQASRLGCRVSFVNDEAEDVNLTSEAKARVLVYDSSISLPDYEVAQGLVVSGESLINLHDYEKERDQYSQGYLRTQQKSPLGKRRVECLNETGISGARYGFDLLENVSPRALSPEQVSVVVFGYGHVARGAVQESLRQGVERVHIVGREQMRGERIVSYIAAADLIINGIDLGTEKGEKFLLSRKHLDNGLVRGGSVVIDLVGGSKQEPSAIEAIRECTFLDRPFFVESNVFFAALWGWPMLYMMKESSDTYSRQITDLFVGEPDLLIKGFESAALGVQRALVKPGVTLHAHQGYGANPPVESVANLDSDSRQ